MMDNHEDKSLEEFFSNYRPALSDSDDFMSQLDRRLAAVEMVKLEQKRQLRRYRYAVVAALSLGIILGGIGCALILTMPEAAPLLSFDSRLVPFMMIEQYSNILVFAIIAAVMTYAIIKLFNLVLVIQKNAAGD